MVDEALPEKSRKGGALRWSHLYVHLQKQGLVHKLFDKLKVLYHGKHPVYPWQNPWILPLGALCMKDW